MGGVMESACLSVLRCVCVSLHLSVYKILVSVKGLVGVWSHIKTALVFVAFVKNNENRVSYFVQSRRKQILLNSFLCDIEVFR